jgi:hypothetical protein
MMFKVKWSEDLRFAGEAGGIILCGPAAGWLPAN